MIFREIKITNEKPLSIQIPESWNEVTYNQLEKVMGEDEPLRRVSILTNITYELFNKYPELADFYVWLESKLDWSNKWDEEDSEVETFILDKEVFNFPKEIGMLSIGLYKDIQSEAQENKDNVLSIYPLICASYYQTLKDGEYDYTKAKEYVSLFREQPCRKVWNAAGFFLNKVKLLRSGMKREQRKGIIPMIRKWLGLIGFQKSLGLKLFPRS